MNVHVTQHPLAKHLITQLRDEKTAPDQFRRYTNNLTTILVLEATQKIKLKETIVQTPIETTQSEVLGQGLAFVPILRAGLSMLEPALQLFPDVAVGYIGMERNEKTAEAQKYYCKLPKLQDRYTICFDPMLATGGSASAAIKMLKENGANHVVMVSVIAAPEGIERLQKDHPDVPIVVATIDRQLNEKKYIVPGLGDFGDRLYGTL